MHLFFTSFVDRTVYTVLILMGGSVPMKRVLAGMIVLFVILPLIALDAFAAEGVIRIVLREDGEVTVCLVGVPEGDHHRLLDAYGGGEVSFDDSLSNELAAWLAQKKRDGITKSLENGVAEFTGLEEGLYLVAQTKGEKGKEKFAPFLVSIPWDGNMWQVEVTPMPPEPPQTGDGIFFFLCMFVLSAGILALKAAPWQKK